MGRRVKPATKNSIGSTSNFNHSSPMEIDSSENTPPVGNGILIFINYMSALHLKLLC